LAQDSLVGCSATSRTRRGWADFLRLCALGVTGACELGFGMRGRGFEGGVLFCRCSVLQCYFRTEYKLSRSMKAHADVILVKFTTLRDKRINISNPKSELCLELWSANGQAEAHRT
jgi:hypothetical protein